MSADVYAASDGPKRRRGLAQMRANQKVMADQLDWPDGALETCWRLENAYPGWSLAWLGENTIKGFERPAGFWAVFDGTYHKVEIHAADAAELEERLAAGPPEHDFSLRGCAWCTAHPGSRRVEI